MMDSNEVREGDLCYIEFKHIISKWNCNELIVRIKNIYPEVNKMIGIYMIGQIIFIKNFNFIENFDKWEYLHTMENLYVNKHDIKNINKPKEVGKIIGEELYNQYLIGKIL